MTDVKTFVKKINLAGWKAHPSVECMVEITVDVDGLAFHLGNKAYRNKSKRSEEVGGLVKVTVRPTQASQEAA